MSEVLYWAEKLKSSWTDQESDERGGVSTLCQTEGGEVEQLSAQQMDIEQLQTGEHPDSCSRFLKCCGYVWVDNTETSTEKFNSQSK